MAGARPSKRGGKFCVAGGPNNVSCQNTSYTEGVSMHYFPTDPVIRQKWTRFVRIHRANYKPVKTSVLCSAHFEPSCYTKRFLFASKDPKDIPKRVLAKGAIPTRDTVVPAEPVPDLTNRRKRQIKRSTLPVSRPAKRRKQRTAVGHSHSPASSLEVVEDSTSLLPRTSHSTGTQTLQMSTSEKASQLCTKCSYQTRRRRNFQRRFNRLKRQYSELKLKFTTDDGIETEEEELANLPEETDTTTTCTESSQGETSDAEWSSMHQTAEEALGHVSADDDDEELEDDISRNNISVDAETPSYQEPKFVVFYTMLLSLFSMFCYKCQKANPKVTMKANGTMVTASQHCEKCGDSAFMWRSQPLVLGRYPAGNMMLSFAVLMAGASISKIALVFKHMGLSMHGVRTYFKHQKVFLFPVVLHHWETYRAKLLSKLKDLKDVVWSGDGRFDSMGHSAKYGAYTMFCCTLMKVIHFELLQANETKGSSPMELEGAKRSFAFLSGMGIAICTFISDRHRGIAKWIRECQPNTRHFYDIWHIARSIGKAMLKASKFKGCERISAWIKGVRNHLYWCAISTKEGFEGMIVAKWKSIMQHVTNRHSNHPDPLFSKCAHGEDIETRQWIKLGTCTYTKLNNVLTNTRILNDVKKLSPEAQTSCLEGFHSTLNHWHPKMIGFSWLGTYCRHVLASLHFNENLRRDTETTKDGKVFQRVHFPKYKLGEEVVRDVAVPPTYSYVDEMKRLLFSMDKSQIQTVSNKYSALAPPPLNTQFPDRLSKEEAVKRNAQKQQREKITLFPSAEEQDLLQATSSDRQTGAAGISGESEVHVRRTRMCRSCHKPMKGHPRNQCKD